MEDRKELEDEGTIEGTIEKGKNVLLIYNNLALLRRLINNDYNIDCPEDNVIYDYLSELKNATIKVELSSAQYLKYKYRPDLLSYDMYGTPIFEYVILALNDIISPKYFTKKKIYMIPEEYMDMLIGEIYDAEKDYITFNRNKYKEESL